MNQEDNYRERAPCRRTKFGRDELNLAEFPLATLSSRAPKNLRTLSFSDRIWDPGQRQQVIRRLTITGSDVFGLPTALDDEVILGLIQLTREDDFGSPDVFFSRYRLIRLLGWRDEGKSYTRLETSLKRWIGVTLFYEKAWWDKQERAWVDESFHILERLALYDRDRRLRRQGMKEPALSSFVWNPVVFRSFQAGYLKQIDMDLFRRLRTPIAKRLYRILDKRFYHRDTWEFDLRELACEHVGMSRTYDNGQLKRKLRAAVAELEGHGFLEPADWPQRFRRVAPGQWTVSFTRRRRSSARRTAAKPPGESTASATKSLHTRKTPLGRAKRGRGTHRSSGGVFRRQMEDYWKSLPPARQRSVRGEAIEHAPHELRETLQQACQSGEKLLAEVYETVILEQHLGRLLGQLSPDKSS
jgi:hypothetical protein